MKGGTRLCFFFFQAEDGIRDADVTGVQTCALPISEDFLRDRAQVDRNSIQPLPNSRKIYVTGSRPDIRVPMREISLADTPTAFGGEPRSEERRVGKECRARLSPDHDKETGREGGVR